MCGFDQLADIVMYAAMPAILKDAMERAYAASGWDLRASENKYGDVFPIFSDLLEQIEKVINESKYSADSKGDYSGALMTRVRSLTTGINSMIFREVGGQSKCKLWQRKLDYEGFSCAKK
jgi:hypothetical protein